MEDSNFATGYAVGRDSNGGYNNGNGMFGNDWAWIIILLLFGWGRNGNWSGGNCGSNATCATPADVNAAVDQQTLISKIDQQTYGIADTFTALNNTLNNNFRGIDNAICTLGYQGAQHANAIQSQLAQCLKKIFTKKIRPLILVNHLDKSFKDNIIKRRNYLNE